MRKRPFTLVVCVSCAGRPGDALLDQLRAIVRRFPHGMLVSTNCLLGSVYCTTRPGVGVIAMLQPCTADRLPAGPPRWIGPICEDRDVADVCDWIMQGQWSPAALPAHLRNPLAGLADASRRN